MLAWLFHEEIWRCSTVIEALHKPERLSITPTVSLGCLEPVLWTGDYSADLVTGCLLQHPAWSRKRPAAPVDAQCLCFLLFPSPAGCSAILPSNLLFFSPPPGLLQVAVPHCEGGGFVCPAVHAAELPALTRGISLGKAVSGTWVRAFS